METDFDFGNFAVIPFFVIVYFYQIYTEVQS